MEPAPPQPPPPAATTPTGAADPAAPLVRSGGCVVLLFAGGELGWSVANWLSQHVDDLVLIEEPAEAKAEIVRRRARLLGWPVAIGQVAFGLLSRIPNRRGKARAADIQARHGLTPTPTARPHHHRVESDNADGCRSLLRDLAPSVIAVYGTRLLSAQTLAASPAPFINYHAGINPAYRGQHPAYWALAKGDAANVGVTIHLVDSGVDTGHVLYQARVEMDPGDTIATYQWVQLPHALPLLARAIGDARAGRLTPHVVDLPSAKHFPPTLWSYLWTGFTRGVW